MQNYQMSSYLGTHLGSQRDDLEACDLGNAQFVCYLDDRKSAIALRQFKCGLQRNQEYAVYLFLLLTVPRIALGTRSDHRDESDREGYSECIAALTSLCLTLLRGLTPIGRRICQALCEIKGRMGFWDVEGRSASRAA